MALILVTSSCVSAEKMDDATTAGLDPFVVEGDGQVTAKVIAASLKRGRRALVIFDEFSDVAGNKWKCPVKIRTVDNVCMDPDFQNSDPSVICRWAGDNGNRHLSQKKIKWESENGETFKIFFVGAVTPVPCKAGWDGDEFDDSHTCKIQAAADLNMGASDAIFLKYDVKGEDARCDKLDPYFIVRK